MAKVAFISHASEDAAIAAIVTEHLERKGIFCWIAPRDVTPGSNYSTEIVGAIEAGAVFVLILSENANKLLFVMREVERAVSKGKPVFPIRVREVTPSPSLELFISSAHWIDAWQPPLEKHLEQLAQSISSVAAVQVPTPKPAGVGDLSPRLRRFLSIAIAATVLLVLGGGSWYAHARKEVARLCSAYKDVRDGNDLALAAREREKLHIAMDSFNESWLGHFGVAECL